MKTIAVLIDFTEGSIIALQKATNLAQVTHFSVAAIHIVSSPNKVANADIQLDEFIHKHNTSDVTITTHVTIGGLVDGTQEALRNINPELVIICTHGVVGVKQHVFGAQILKLVQGLSYPSIVFRSNSTLDFGKIDKIMMPAGPHPEYMLKIKQTGYLANLLHATVLIYRINRPGMEFEDILIKNERDAIKYFEANNIPFTSIIEDFKVLSVGFSRQTLEFATTNQIKIISLMANVSRNDALFGYGDKESFLVNENGITIITCN